MFEAGQDLWFPLDPLLLFFLMLMLVAVEAVLLVLLAWEVGDLQGKT